MKPDNRLESTFSLFAFSSSYTEDVIKKKRERAGVETVFAEDPEARAAAEAALDAILSAPELLPLTRAEVLQILERIAAFHGRAYGWETPVTAEALYAVTESGGYLLRTRIRAAIEYLDQLYQYGAASESVTAPLQQERYDEDETPELSDLDTL
ncbi:MAG: hypothetical protein IKI17_08285 [Oscillospiraceae bacterium]|nr:hypothetical protein [Oscillospiraceae bacterium]